MTGGDPPSGAGRRRRRAPGQARPDEDQGAFFWPEELWIHDPPGWHQTIQRGRAYDLREGDGRRIRGWWSSGSTPPRERGRGREPAVPAAIPGGYSDPFLQRRRLGRGTFSALVTDAYRRRCAITEERALPALEAAHIRPFRDVQEHVLSNGILLRSDIHKLFDAGYVTITPEYRAEASQRMREDFDDGESYLRLHGSRLPEPATEDLRPDRAVLQWHNETVFRR